MRTPSMQNARVFFHPLAGLLAALLVMLAASLPARAGMDIQEVVSDKGIKAWLVEDYTVPIVTIQMAFKGGSTQDPDGKAGMANLITGLFDEGAGDLDKLDPGWVVAQNVADHHFTFFLRRQLDDSLCLGDGFGQRLFHKNMQPCVEGLLGKFVMRIRIRTNRHRIGLCCRDGFAEIVKFGHATQFGSKWRSALRCARNQAAQFKISHFMIRTRMRCTHVAATEHEDFNFLVHQCILASISKSQNPYHK